MNEFLTKVTEIDEFGGGVLDVTPDELSKNGFDFGDTVDLFFSNTVVLQNVPYFNGYYVKFGDPVIVAYPGYQYPVIGFNGRNFHEKTGVVAGDSVRWILREKGGMKSTMELRSVSYSNDPDDYLSRDQFANARKFRVGKMAPGKFFRCASPFDHLMNRPEAVCGFLEENQVKTTLSISENEASLKKRFDKMPVYAKELYETGGVIPLGLGADYYGDEFKSGLCRGLIIAMDKPFPWAIHCLEGKDRTGFVCILLGILMGASYNELENDYMETYSNYYGITKETDPFRYDAFKKTFLDEYLDYFSDRKGFSPEHLEECQNGVRKYLLSGGMSDSQIEKLKRSLS